MKTKILCVLIAVGGVIACYQNRVENYSKPAWDVLRQAQPKTVIPIDRHSLSQQVLTQSTFLSDFDLPQSPQSDSELAALDNMVNDNMVNDNMVNVSYSGDLSVGSTSSQQQNEPQQEQEQPTGPSGPSAYQQKLADQKAWRSFQRPVHLNLACESLHQANVDAIAGRNRLVVSSSVDGQPIVPGIADPHQWYAGEEAKPTESLAGMHSLPPLPESTPEPELTGSEVVAIEMPNEGQQELDFNAIVAEPMPSVKSLLAEVASKSNAAQAPFEFEPTSALAEATPTPTPSQSQPTQRVARRWESGRY